MTLDVITGVHPYMWCKVCGIAKFTSVSGTESLVQVTVVAGPPVEIQVRVSRSRSSMMLPDRETPPEFTQKNPQRVYTKCLIYTGFSCTFIRGI